MNHPTEYSADSLREENIFEQAIDISEKFGIFSETQEKIRAIIDQLDDCEKETTIAMLKKTLRFWPQIEVDGEMQRMTVPGEKALRKRIKKLVQKGDKEMALIDFQNTIHDNNLQHSTKMLTIYDHLTECCPSLQKNNSLFDPQFILLNIIAHDLCEANKKGDLAQGSIIDDKTKKHYKNVEERFASIFIFNRIKSDEARSYMKNSNKEYEHNKNKSPKETNDYNSPLIKIIDCIEGDLSYNNALFQEVDTGLFTIDDRSILTKAKHLMDSLIGTPHSEKNKLENFFLKFPEARTNIEKSLERITIRITNFLQDLPAKEIQMIHELSTYFHNYVFAAYSKFRIIEKLQNSLDKINQSKKKAIQNKQVIAA
ncbi:hypothetical protein COB57_03805 [Candidatus Peregrinibacteria bacterium]|nr:MAG: hypothetical protein COB57_03805 [Candidatus Peregrinibacteria bacterium]